MCNNYYNFNSLNSRNSWFLKSHWPRQFLFPLINSLNSRNSWFLEIRSHRRDYSSSCCSVVHVRGVGMPVQSPRVLVVCA